MEGDGHPRRKALKVAVGCLLMELGYGTAEDSALETLTEMLQAYMSEIGRKSKSYCEHAGRTEPMVSDVVISLIDMGLDIRGIPAHAKRANKSVFLPPAVQSHVPTPKTLQVGERKNHPPHIHDFLPPFPDPHTYIKTDAIRQPFNEYQVIRERAATQARDVTRALTRLIAKSGETQSLFKDDTSAFPLIAVKPVARPCLDALLPRDQDLDLDLLNQLHEAAVASSRPRLPLLPLDVGSGEAGMGGDDASQNPDTDVIIDNPYLRGVRMPRNINPSYSATTPEKPSL